MKNDKIEKQQQNEQAATFPHQHDCPIALFSRENIFVTGVTKKRIENQIFDWVHAVLAKSSLIGLLKLQETTKPLAKNNWES